MASVVGRCIPEESGEDNDTPPLPGSHLQQRTNQINKLCVLNRPTGPRGTGTAVIPSLNGRARQKILEISGRVKSMETLRNLKSKSKRLRLRRIAAKSKFSAATNFKVKKIKGKALDVQAEHCQTPLGAVERCATSTSVPDGRSVSCVSPMPVAPQVDIQRLALFVGHLLPHAHQPEQLQTFHHGAVGCCATSTSVSDGRSMSCLSQMPVAPRVDIQRLALFVGSLLSHAYQPEQLQTFHHAHVVETAYHEGAQGSCGAVRRSCCSRIGQGEGQFSPAQLSRISSRGVQAGSCGDSPEEHILGSARPQDINVTRKGEPTGVISSTSETAKNIYRSSVNSVVRSLSTKPSSSNAAPIQSETSTLTSAKCPTFLKSAPDESSRGNDDHVASPHLDSEDHQCPDSSSQENKEGDVLNPCLSVQHLSRTGDGSTDDSYLSPVRSKFDTVGGPHYSALNCGGDGIIRETDDESTQMTSRKRPADEQPDDVVKRRQTLLVDSPEVHVKDSGDVTERCESETDISPRKEKKPEHARNPASDRGVLDDAEKNDTDILFEDLDEKDLENMLAVSRQQELQALLGDGKSITSASDQRQLFRKFLLGRSQLPPELSHCKIFRPQLVPKPGTKEQSALHALESQQPKWVKIEKKSVAFNEQMGQSSESASSNKAKKKLSLSREKRDESPKDHTVDISSAQQDKYMHYFNAFKEANKGKERKTPDQDVGEKGEPEPRRVTRWLASCQLRDELKKGWDKRSVPIEEAENIRKPEPPQVPCKSEGVSCALDVLGNSNENMGESCSEESSADIFAPAQHPTGSRKAERTSCSILCPKTMRSESKRPTTAHEESTTQKDFKEQMQERRNSLKLRWAEERCRGCPDLASSTVQKDKELMPPPPPLPSVLKTGASNNNILEGSSIMEVAYAHDLAVHVILNPWRGICARKVSKKFRHPAYDSKAVSAALWDLRSHAPEKEIERRILDLNWKVANIKAFENMVSIFTLALSKSSPFIIEAAVCDDVDEVESVSSTGSSDTKKKTTPIRLVASRLILKGERIDGLSGLILSASDLERSKLRSWNFPKFSKGRRFGIYGSVAYLKSDKESNVKAILSNDVNITTKATRNILKGELFIINYKNIERRLFRK